MNYFDSEHVYFALPSFFKIYFWRDAASSLVPGGVWRVKRGSFGTFLGWLAGVLALERRALCALGWVTVPPCGICLQRQRHPVPSAAFTSFSKDSPWHCPMGFFFPNTQTPAGNTWCFIPVWGDRPLPTARTEVTGPKPCDKHSVLIIPLVTSCCSFVF